MESDPKEISGGKLVVHGFLLNEFDDFVPPRKVESGYQMHLNEADWFIPELVDCP